MRKPGSHAFTLVELLVVIGIIALLISILLPGLNKAKQQANQLDCQARLRGMGQALSIYVATAKGSLPWGVVVHGAPEAPWTDAFAASTADQEKYNWWMFTLSEIMVKTSRDENGFGKLSPVFRDRDTIEPTLSPRYINHYICNPRVLYQANNYDSVTAIFSNYGILEEPAKDRRPRKLGSIKGSSNVFVIWDGPQTRMQYGSDVLQYNAYPIADSIDSYGLYNTTGLCFDAPYALNQYGRAILPGSGGGASGVTDGKAVQKKVNVDFDDIATNTTTLRFRHLGNTSLAALCLDGHVETRKVGTVLRTDIFTNYK